MVDQVAPSLKLVRYASVSVAGQLVLNVLDDCSEFSIPSSTLSQSIGNNRCFSGDRSFCTPSDRAGRGPVMMEELALSAAIGWRGVFFARSSSMVSWPTLRSRAAMWTSYSAMTLASPPHRSDRRDQTG